MRQHISYADWTFRELQAIASGVLFGRLRHGCAAAQLADGLTELYAPSSAHLLNSAHHGIGFALTRLRQLAPARDEVILPTYICPSVPDTVRACGLSVRWATVSEDLNLSAESVGAVLGKRTLAVVAPHMFGCPAPLPEIEQLCLEAGVALIDDAAQVAGVRVGGRLLGTFGDAGVISFAQSKTIVAGVRGAGGVLLLNRAERTKGWSEQLAALAPATGRTSALIDFAMNYQLRRYMGGLGHRMAQLFPSRFGPVSSVIEAHGISELDARIALVQLSRLDALVADRTRLVQSYQRSLQSFPRLQFPQYAPDRFLARVMLLLPAGVPIEDVRQAALDRGVETRLGYRMDASAEQVDPRVSAWARRMLGVPVRRDMDDNDVLWVCARLDEAISDVSR